MPDDKIDIEEEISLGGHRPPIQPPSGPTDAAAPGGDDDEHSHIDARSANLEGIVGPGSSDAELVEAILQLPADRLIPWEVCKIPSLGVYYGWPGSEIEVRAMTQTAEKILATQRLAQSGQSMDYLFRECCRWPEDGFDPADLLVGDRVFILYYIRGITHGNIYEFAVTCANPACKKSSTHSYDLNVLAGTIQYADRDLGPEPFKVTLPYMSRSTGRDFWVEIRLLRGRDTNNMVAMRKMRNRLAAPPIRTGKQERNPFRNREQEEIKIDDTLTENLQLIITSVMGVTDRGHISAFVPKMHASDTAVIREWLRNYSPGIDTTVAIECPECGQEFTVELPITESFFRPTQK